MPLRKKHVRLTLAVVLMVVVLVPLGWLAVWGLWLRGGLDDTLKAELESRLRCQAKVRGARPAGLGAATVDELQMTWEAGAGKLTLLLRGIEAKAGEQPQTWLVTAASGSLDLAGPQPMETLSALNQRLVQADDKPLPLAGLAVENLRLGLDTDALTVTDQVKLDSYVVKKGMFIVNLTRRAGTGGAPSESTDATIQLNPTSPDGLFRAVTADVHGFPARQIVLKGAARNDPRERTGTLDPVIVTWPPPGKGRRPPCQVDFTAQKLALADWTGGLRGGPATGTAEVALAWKKEGDRPATLEVHVASQDGQIQAETFQALATLPGGIFGAGKLLKGPVSYGRAAWTVRVTGRSARFVGEADLWGRIPLVELRVLGYPLPILWASGATFDASSAWPRFDEVLFGAGPAKGEARPSGTGAH